MTEPCEVCIEADTEECLECGQEFYTAPDSYQFCNACLGVNQEEREEAGREGVGAAP